MAQCILNGKIIMSLSSQYTHISIFFTYLVAFMNKLLSTRREETGICHQRNLYNTYLSILLFFFHCVIIWAKSDINFAQCALLLFTYFHFCRLKRTDKPYYIYFIIIELCVALMLTLRYYVLWTHTSITILCNLVYFSSD